MTDDAVTQQEEIQPQTPTEYYDMLRTMLESLERDVHKFESGTKAAGVRVRKGLRLIRDETNRFVKFTLGK
tara:strand:- start:42 stop:254 length:213 start_codon:yes stop_codon:yes gene_type:complete